MLSSPGVLNPSGSYDPFLSSKGLPKLCLRSGCGSLYLLPPTAKGSLLQQNIIRNHFVCLFIYCQSCLVLSLAILAIQTVSGMGSLSWHGMGLKLEQSLVVTPTSSAPPLPQHVLQTGQIVGQKCYGLEVLPGYRRTVQTPDFSLLGVLPRVILIDSREFLLH